MTAVLVMMLSASLIVGCSNESDAASDDWTCTITVSNSTITTKYAKGGSALADTTPVNGIIERSGSWAFDSNGYGPFNSFYAAFDSSGKMVCHLNPSNLTKSIDNVSIAGKGYNIMWCIPQIYLKTSGSTLTMSSSSSDGTLAPAFTVGGKAYNYLGIGVYEATLSGSVLGSQSEQTPQASTSLANYRTYAHNAKVEGGQALLWNFHMYQLYRMCSLAVMENFDSQAQIGYGNASGSGSSETGGMDYSGPYFGTSSASATGAKLFIENAWGSLFEYVDDAWWSSGLYAGQNLNPTSDTSNKTKTSVKSGISGYGTYPYSTQLDSWGLPTTTSSSNSATAPDYYYSKSSGGALLVGGAWNAGAYAGLSYLYDAVGGGGSSVGSRLSFLFDADSAATPTVTLDYSALTSAGGDATGFPAKIKIENADVTYPNLNTYTSNPSIKAGWTHIGWEVNGTRYAVGAKVASIDSHTAKALWAEPKNIIFDHSALKNIGGDVDGLPDKQKIVDANTVYPDLNTYSDNQSIKDGYRHVGYYIDGTFYQIGAKVKQTTSHTAYSAWIVPQIEITFMVEGKVHSTLTVPKDSCGVVYTPVIVEGVFEGWFYDSSFTQKYDSSKKLTSDVTLYAKGVPPLEFTSVPSASATITSVDANGMYYFDATESQGKYKIAWDFGDGNTSEDAIAYNTYSEPGHYTVTLTITNIYGDTSTATYGIDVGTEDGQDKDFGRGIVSMLVIAIAGAILIVAVVRRMF